MTSACPRCRSPLPAPMPRVCPQCKEPLALTTSGLEARPDMTLRAPRLVGKIDGRPSEFVLGPRTAIGRHPSNAIRLNDREVSKEHAVIERVGAGFVLRDLGSSNGTFVN